MMLYRPIGRFLSYLKNPVFWAATLLGLCAIVLVVTVIVPDPAAFFSGYKMSDKVVIDVLQDNPTKAAFVHSHTCAIVDETKEDAPESFLSDDGKILVSDHEHGSVWFRCKSKNVNMPVDVIIETKSRTYEVDAK